MATTRLDQPPKHAASTDEPAATKRIHTPSGYLEPLSVRHAPMVFDLVHSSRKALHQWLPWLSKVHSVHDMQSLIRKLLNDSDTHYVLFLDESTAAGAVSLRQGIPNTQSAILGFWLGQDFMGNGLMHETLQSAFAHAFDELNYSALEVHCPVNNDTARKVPVRLGFKLVGITSRSAWLADQYVDQAIYRLTHGAYLAQAHPHQEAPITHSGYPHPGL